MRWQQNLGFTKNCQTIVFALLEDEDFSKKYVHILLLR
jgi:hypothetical protein